MTSTKFLDPSPFENEKSPLTRNFPKSAKGRKTFKLPNTLKRPKIRYLNNFGPPQAEFFWGATFQRNSLLPHF